MNRSGIVGWAGAIVAAVGVFVCLRASDLATNWQRTESGNGWGGRTDPALQHTYLTLGAIAVVFGLALVAAAAWHWMRGYDAGGRPPIEA
jgi:hypothetical protein